MAVQRLLAAVRASRLPLDVPGVERARLIQCEAAEVLDDAILRRLRAPRGPLLVAVGGGTGVGKSTLVNSMVREVVSPAGVLRPTTRDAVVVCHPGEVGGLAGLGFGGVGGAMDDAATGGLAGLGFGGVGGAMDDAAVGESAAAFGGAWPGGERGDGDGTWPGGERGGDGGAWAVSAQGRRAGRSGSVAAASLSFSLFSPRPLPRPTLPIGIALADTPDINSVVAGNREVGARWMAAADVVVFVTSAARYADAAPWRFLKRAAGAGTPLLVVVDRVPAGAVDEVREACGALLQVNGLGAAPLFVVCEGLGADGLLPGDAVLPVVEWLRAAGAEPAGRERIGVAAVAGRWGVLAGRVGELAAACDVQRQAVDSLQQAVERVYTAERVRFRGGLEDGELFGGEVLIRWQELVGSDRVRTLMGAADPRGRRAAGAERAVDGPLREALVDAVGQAIRVALDRAVRRTGQEWGLVLSGAVGGVVDGTAGGAVGGAVGDRASGAVGGTAGGTVGGTGMVSGRSGPGKAEMTGDAAAKNQYFATPAPPTPNGRDTAAEARAAAANWLDRLPGAIRDQARARRASRATAGAGARGAALLLGVAAVAGRLDSTEPTTAAAHALVRALFGPEDSARLLAVARTGLRDASAALLERSADGYRAQIASLGVASHVADELRAAQASVQSSVQASLRANVQEVL